MWVTYNHLLSHADGNGIVGVVTTCCSTNKENQFEICEWTCFKGTTKSNRLLNTLAYPLSFAELAESPSIEFTNKSVKCALAADLKSSSFAEATVISGVATKVTINANLSVKTGAPSDVRWPPSLSALMTAGSAIGAVTRSEAATSAVAVVGHSFNVSTRALCKAPLL